MYKAIYFDMDGTLCDFYNVEGWLDYLYAEQTKPYRVAKPLVDMRKLGKVLNQLQAQGWKIGIISWLSRGGSDEYGERVAKTKEAWLAKHLGSVDFDEVKIAKYGTPKQFLADHAFGILFDDEQPNRDNWVGEAYDVHNILAVLGTLIE